MTGARQLLAIQMRACLVAAVCLVTVDAAAPEQSPATPTYGGAIAPLFNKSCVVCHQPGGDAPFSLTTYEEARRRAQAIVQVTASRFMPPWKPDGDSPAFLGDRRLSDGDITTIRQWVDAGAPEGPPDGLTQRPPAAAGWLWGEPDLIVSVPPYSLRADGLDVFRNFVITVPGRGKRYVRGLQFRPRSRGVHHANIRIDPTPASRALDDADPAPGYEGVILHSADYPDGHFLGWTPGQAAPPSSDSSWTLEGGSDLVVQLHMRPTGRVEEIAPLIGFYFTSAPPSLAPTIVRLGRQNLDIPPDAAEYVVTDSFRLPAAAQIVAIQPHSHYRAREVAAWADLPDGSRQSLIHIGDWDFGWQDQYRLAEPIRLPAGATLAMTFRFDNSARNPRNPSHPPERAQWGWRSADEMADVWIQLLTASDADRRTISNAARRKMTEEDAIGSEVLIAREPNHVNLRNDAALIYRELGRFDQALVHFSAVTRLEPASPAAHYNEGVTLEALGREADAQPQYAEAIRLDPSYALAHNALGNALYRSRRLDEAIVEYRAAVRSDGRLALAHCSLARALTEFHKPQEAIAEYRSAIAAAPDSVPCLINFAWLLGAHRDGSIRRPAEAIRFAERAAALTGRASADALDVLAAAYASDGRFGAAIDTALEALRLLGSSGASPLVAEIRARLDLYKRNLPFVVPDR